MSDQQQTWYPVYDENSGRYYYWNTITQETSWENPFQSTSSTAASSSVQPGAAATLESSIASTAAPQSIQQAASSTDSGFINAEHRQDGYADYNVTGYFNPRTGRFEKQEAAGTSQEIRSYMDSKSYREMNSYFDYKSWVDARNSEEYKQQEEERKNKKPTRRDIQQFKKAKKERQKAKRKWLFED